MTYELRTVNVDDVVIGERYREEFGDIEELMESIKEKGVIQPISLDQNMNLLAGERRLTACFNLKIKTIPAIIREVVDEIDAREIELMENIHRRDFTWQERAKLTAKIHELYCEKDPNWSGRKTAKLIDRSAMDVSRALRLDAAMKVSPEIEECRSADDALKVMRKAEESAIVAELTKRQAERVETAAKAPAGKNHKERQIANAIKAADRAYVIGDTIQHLKGMRVNGHVDFIECDPPYGIDLKDKVIDKRGADTKATYETYNEIPEDQYGEFLTTLTSELYRVAAKDCWMVFWFAFKWHREALQALKAAGWAVDEVPGLWLKGNGRTPRPDYLLARAYEPFFICRKGQPTIIKQGRTNTYMRNPDEKKIHPAQRPVGLMEDILNTFIDGTKHVLVPFVGSGATLRAAFKLGHQPLGFDNNPEYKPSFLLSVEEDTKKLLAKD